MAVARKEKNSSLFFLTAVSSEAILAPLGSVVSCVTGAGAPEDDAGVGSTRPGRGSVMGTPEEKKRSEEAAAAIGATTAEDCDVDNDDDEASAEAAARPARGSSPDSREAALDDETMVEFGKKGKKKSLLFFERESRIVTGKCFLSSTSTSVVFSSLFLSFLSLSLPSPFLSRKVSQAAIFSSETREENKNDITTPGEEKKNENATSSSHPRSARLLRCPLPPPLPPPLGPRRRCQLPELLERRQLRDAVSPADLHRVVPDAPRRLRGN